MTRFFQLGIVAVLLASSGVWAQEPTKTRRVLNAGEGDVVPEEDEKIDAVNASEQKPKVQKTPLHLVDVVPLGETPLAMTERLSQALKKELSELYVIDTSSLISAKDKSADEAARKSADDSVEKGDKLLAAAQKKVVNMDFRGGQKLLDAAYREIVKGVSQLKSIQPAVAFHLTYAEIYARRGLEKERDLALMQAATIDPEASVTVKSYPEDFVAAFDKARKAVTGAAKGSVAVDKSGAGATVYLDGRELGIAPMQISDVPAGMHFIRVSREGGASYGGVIKVVAGKAKNVAPGFVDFKSQTTAAKLGRNQLDAGIAAELSKKGKGPALFAVAYQQGAKLRTAFVVATRGNVVLTEEIVFDAELLNLTIQSEKLVAALEKAKAGEAKPVAPGPLLRDLTLPGDKVAEVAMRFDLPKIIPDKKAVDRKVVGGLAKEQERTLDIPDAEDRKVMSGGTAGNRKTLRDDEVDRLSGESAVEEEADDQMALIIGLSVAGGALLVAAVSAGTYYGLLDSGAIPDDRPRNGLQLKVVVP